MKALGVHCIAEFYNCDVALLNSHRHIKKLFVTAAKESGATIVKVAFHKFNPWGVSGVVVIAESHLTIHTWPEYGYAAVDIFTCGDLINNTKILESIKEGLKAGACSTSVIHRGILREARDRLLV